MIYFTVFYAIVPYSLTYAVLGILIHKVSIWEGKQLMI